MTSTAAAAPTSGTPTASCATSTTTGTAAPSSAVPETTPSATSPAGRGAKKSVTLAGKASTAPKVGPTTGAGGVHGPPCSPFLGSRACGSWGAGRRPVGSRETWRDPSQPVSAGRGLGSTPRTLKLPLWEAVFLNQGGFGDRARGQEVGLREREGRKEGRDEPPARRGCFTPSSLLGQRRPTPEPSCLPGAGVCARISGQAHAPGLGAADTPGGVCRPVCKGRVVAAPLCSRGR